MTEVPDHLFPTPAALEAAREALRPLADEHQADTTRHSNGDQGWCPICQPVALRAAYAVDAPKIRKFNEDLGQ